MQSLWSLKIDWIDELPSERAKEWHLFLEDFNSSCSNPTPDKRIAVASCFFEKNPAYLVLRGIDPSSLHNNSLWWNGPTFLATKDFPERNILSSVTDSDEFN
ncbi:hypothetical protein TNCV_3283231 [Trichonephila clavipes]|nr:hypothetical protein TNCV_3283231 [Trichonephila clavipes]